MIQIVMLFLLVELTLLVALSVFQLVRTAKLIETVEDLISSQEHFVDTFSQKKNVENENWEKRSAEELTKRLENLQRSNFSKKFS